MFQFVSKATSTAQTNSDTGWKSGWGLNSRPQQQGLFSGRQTPQIVQEKTGFLGGLSTGFLTQTSTQQDGNTGKEDEYERKMRGKRRQDDLEWFADFLNGKNPGHLDEDEQYGSLLMGLHTGGAKLDTKELNELKRLAGRTRQQEELKEQERSKPRQRKRAEDLTEEELMEIEVLDKQREEAEVAEYLELLALKESGEEVDSVRLKILDLLDKRKCDEALTEEDNDLLMSYEDQVMETHLDRIEMKFLTSLKQGGKKFDEDRLSELELLQLQQHNVDFNEEELNQLDWFDSKRIREVQCLDELIVIREKQAAGEEVNEEHLKFLELLNRKVNGELLEGSELDQIAFHEKQWKKESREQAANEATAANPIQAEDVDNRILSPKSGKTNVTLESKDLRRIGLPPNIEVSSISSFDHSAASIGGLSGGSYVEDLTAQRNLRYELREEQTFDEALYLYETKLRETNQPESEQLFSQIYHEMQVKSSKKHEQDDKIADEYLKEAAKAYEVQRKHLKAERSAFKAQKQKFVSSLEEETDTETAKEKFLSNIPKDTLRVESESSTSNALMARWASTPGIITPNRSNDVPAPEESRAEEDVDRKESKDFLNSLDKGKENDEDRLYRLGLFERYGLGESMTSNELEDLRYLKSEKEKERHKIDSNLDHRTTKGSRNEARQPSVALNGSLRVNDFTPVPVNSEEIDWTQENIRTMDSIQVESVGKSIDRNHESKDTKNENYADAEELQELLHKFEQGEDIDEDRLYELMLLERHRMGESLTSDEREGLKSLLHGGEEENSSASQHSKLHKLNDVPSVPSEPGVISPAHRNVKELDSSQIDLMETSIEGNHDRTDSRKEIDRSNQTEMNNTDSEELQDLLDRLERGEDIDEDRLYELELLERHRMGESLTSVEREDLEVLFQERNEEDSLDSRPIKSSKMDDVPSVLTESDAIAVAKIGTESIETSINENHGNKDRKTDFNGSSNTKTNGADAEELQELLHKFEQGEDIDEDRLYELMHRMGESLTSDKREGLKRLLHGAEEKKSSASQHRKLQKLDDFLSIPSESDARSTNHTSVVEPPQAGLMETSKVVDTSSLLEESVATSAVQTSTMDPVLPENEVRDTSIEGNDDKADMRIEMDSSSHAPQANSDSEELQDLLDRLERGEDIDEDRLYELELLERHRMGESLT
ncbi:unnamed protein product, partial [Cylindrotheca closterium]